MVGQPKESRRGTGELWGRPWSPSICSQLHPWEAEHGSHTLTTQMESSPDVRLNWTDHTLVLITNSSAGVFYCCQTILFQSLLLSTVGHQESRNTF